MSATKSSPGDFSLFSLFTAGLACLVPFTAAYTQPVGDEPKGNPISQPGLNSVVPAGQPFSVTWEPTTQGTVTLVLLKGPSTNAVPQYAIAEKIENNGTYAWTPSTDLAPGDTGYGIQLICDSNGQYQYTTQFGISNPDYKSHPEQSSWSSGAWGAGWSTSTWAYASTTASASSSASASPVAAMNATTTASVQYNTEVVTKFTTYCPYATSFAINNRTYTVSSATTLTISDCPCTITTTKPASATIAPVMTGGTAVVSTGMPNNATIIKPTGSMTVPSSLKTSATATGSSSVAGAATATGSSTGLSSSSAAGSVATSFVGLVIAAGVAVFAM